MAEADELRTLEESLWRAQTRFDLEHMESVLSPDFAEFGRSGRTYTRDEILALEPGELGAELPLADFCVAAIAAGVRLVTYVSEVDGERAKRSSLWVRAPDGWKLRFHQGTPCT